MIPYVTDIPDISIPAQLLPADGRFGSGPSKVRPEAVAALVSVADGDARAALGTLEVALALAGDEPVSVQDVGRARAGRLLHQGADSHYDQTSALIKAIRGSDPDAGLYWLARMLDAGEDARFIARRLVILASEDVGMADPLALVVAEAAARAVEFVGLPEAQLNLAQAVVHLATAPKSNRVALGIWAASQLFQQSEKPVFRVVAAIAMFFPVGQTFFPAIDRRSRPGFRRVVDLATR